MISLGFISLALSIACRSCAELQQHGKLIGMRDDDSFTGERSYYRKYANPLQPPKDSVYYRFFNIGYKERFLFSSTFLVWTTDLYHLCQMLFFLLLSLAITLFIGFNWYLLLGVWLGIRIIHAGIYKLLSR